MREREMREKEVRERERERQQARSHRQNHRFTLHTASAVNAAFAQAAKEAGVEAREGKKGDISFTCPLHTCDGCDGDFGAVVESKGGASAKADYICAWTYSFRERARALGLAGFAKG